MQLRAVPLPHHHITAMTDIVGASSARAMMQDDDGGTLQRGTSAALVAQGQELIRQSSAELDATYSADDEADVGGASPGRKLMRQVSGYGASSSWH